MSDKNIILSICMMGRNDDYGKDFIRRFRQSMNFLAYSAKKAGVSGEIEVVFVDWNSDVPLSSTIELSQDAAGMVKFVIVPPEIAKEHNWENTPFHTTKAINVAARRANGKYIAFMPGDILLPYISIKNLFSVLSPGKDIPFKPEASMMGVERKCFPLYFRDDTLFTSNETIERIILLNSHFLREDKTPKGISSGFGMIIMHNSLQSKLRGMNETFGGWGASDTELGIRSNLSGPLINLSGFGIICYDFDAGKKMVNEKKERNNTKSITKISSLHVNSENWGLKDKDFVITKAKTSNNTKIGHCVPSKRIISVKKLLSPSFRMELLMKFRFMKFLCMGNAPSVLDKISAEAIIVANLAEQIMPKNYLEINNDDISITVPLSLVSAGTDLVITSSSEKNFYHFFYTGLLLEETRHVGLVHFLPIASSSINKDSFNHLNIENKPMLFDLIYLNLNQASEKLEILERVKPLMSQDSALVIKYHGNKDSMSRMIEVIRKTFDDKSIIVSCLFNIIICANTDSTQKYYEIHYSSAKKAWTPFQGNFVSKFIIGLAVDWSKVSKLIRILARINILTMLKAVKYTRKL